MVQRKDSLCYVEFIRGKYDIKNKDYIMMLFSNMTSEERDKIHNNDFDTLWNAMWCRNGSSEEENSKNFNKEYKDAYDKFVALLNGYNIICSLGNKPPIFFNLQYILDNTTPTYEETEWGFPKGRRNINEDDISCALREFREETALFLKNIRLSKDIKPLEEVFSGSNKVRYKHVYYVARYQPSTYSPPMYDPDNTHQNKEVKDVQWFSYQEAQEKIRDCNIERKELFKRLNQLVIKSYQHMS